jgi:tricorn protease
MLSMLLRGSRRTRAAAALAAALLAAAALPVPAQQQEARLLRFPHIHGNTVLFTHGGDLYTAPLAGGAATRLTSHEGLELLGKFSPDGRQIAFSAEYAGTRQVYVIPATGGEPRQLTYYGDAGAMPPRGGYDHLVVDWTPDGQRILMRAARTPFGDRNGRYFLVDPAGGLELPLEIPEGATGATFDASGTKLAYNIVSREWRHWKRYEGGRQQDVWTYDLANRTSQRITETERATDNFPMWIGDRIYFTSDRGAGRKLNIWMHDLATNQVTQVTRHEDHDVLWPSRGEGGIVYEAGGWIWHLDPATGASRKLSITIPGDRAGIAPRWVDARERIESAAISPSAKRVAFGARGEIFTVPAEHGDSRNLSRSPGVRERNVTWSPDGRTLAYLSDESGSYELYVRPADGSGTPRRLTRTTNTWLNRVVWSPDSRLIALADNANQLQVVDVASGNTTLIDRTTTGELNDFAWSGDSRWLAYAKVSPNTIRAIWIAPAAGGSAVQVTDATTDVSGPVFDPAGRYLYFVSTRDFNYGQMGFDARIYVATLRRDVPHPFPFRSDEEPAAAPPRATTAAAAPTDTAAAAARAPVRIDFDGLGTRVVALPGLRAGSYFALRAVPDGIVYMSAGALKQYKLSEREEKTVLEGISAFDITPDAKKVLYRRQNDWGIVNLAPAQKNDAGRLPLDGLQLRIDPRQEWAQVYHDAWLIMRDFFYDPDMHGVDWDAMYQRYLPLVEHATHRSDLDFIIAELIAELNVGHAYVNSSPEMTAVKRVPVGLLGAEFVPDGERYRIVNIFPGENWHEPFRSPLTEPGVDVREGDYLLAIDGEEVTTRENPYRFLTNKASRTVRVTVSDRPAGTRRNYDVRPVTSELGLRYQEWVLRNAALVDSLSGGRIGYIHLPNTGIEGHRELVEGFRPQHTKEALILDDRYNGGGFIPERMAMMVGAPLLNYWSRRHLELYSQPFVVHTGPKAVLINGQSSSGGDAFPYYFKRLGLGPLIGERTWGGLVGISGNPDFVDGGSIAVPRFAFVDADGNWAVEGEGVHPDITVIDRPEQIARGQEPMIERAVQYLLEELDKPQYQRPVKPVGPIRR